MSKYKNIKVVLDIHRDAIGEGGESGKTKPVFKYKGKKAAQIMIMTGYSYEGGGYFPFWEENLRFALKLQQTAETMYPGMTRPLNFGEYTYNLNVCNGSLLIEVGTDVNTFAEVKRTGTMLGKALAKVLQNN
jgi:stage II sporulation protein P